MYTVKAFASLTGLPFQNRLAFRYKASVRKLLAEINYEEIQHNEQHLQQFKKDLAKAFQLRDKE